jgi:hypothetical protein
MTSKVHLAFELTSHSFTISEIHEQEVNILTHCVFNSSSEREMKQEMQLAMSAIPMTQEYEFQTLSWVSKQCTLVPTSIFKASSIASIYSLCFTKEAITNDLDYNTIGEGNCVSIFEIPLWLKSFFVIRYPRIIIQHAMTNLVRSMLDTGKGTNIHLSLFKDTFYLGIVKNNELLLTNVYEYTNEDDLLYFVSFAIQQNEISFDKGKIHLHLSQEADEELINKFYSKWNSMSNFKTYTFQHSPNSLLKQQLTCV